MPNDTLAGFFVSDDVRLYVDKTPYEYPHAVIHILHMDRI